MRKSKVEIKVFVDNKEYTQEELEQIYVERAYFTLHEMQKLGASILDSRGRVIVPKKIDHILPTRVRKILLDNKLRIGKDELNRLYQSQYEEADQMWEGILSDSSSDYSQKVARAHIIVTGLTVGKCLKIIGSALQLKKFLLNMHPDHIDAFMTSVTEIMGMYGRPTRMKGTLKESAPGPVDPEHNLRLIGASYLVNYPGKKNAVAMHQVKKIKGGLDILAGAYFPSATPQELVDGHSIHMAVEFSNAFYFYSVV